MLNINFWGIAVSSKQMIPPIRPNNADIGPKGKFSLFCTGMFIIGSNTTLLLFAFVKNNTGNYSYHIYKYKILLL